MSQLYRLFVYGTLKRGCRNHARLRRQTYLGEAATGPEYALFAAGGFPGMVRAGEQGCAVRGELWEVDAPTLAQLDDFEDNGSLFRREEIAVLTADGRRQTAWAYLYLGEVAGRRDVGPVWEEG
jgi:gamma-glutamylaminecyclotransferase